MRILILNGSARANSGSAHMSSVFAQAAEAAGHEVDVLNVADMDIHGCRGCEFCHTTGAGKCVQRDGMDSVYPAWDTADMIILSSPVYYGAFSGQLSCAIHRTYAGYKPKRCSSMALFLCSGSHGVYEAAEKVYHGFIQGYYGAKDCGVFKATTAEAFSDSMEERLRALAASLDKLA